MPQQRSFPFVDHVGIEIEEQRAGFSRCALTVAPHHFNSSGAVHGGVVFTLADTGMGAALIPELHEGEKCATIEVKINYFKPVVAGLVTCTTEIISHGKSVIHLESSVYSAGVLIAKASGNYAVLRPSNRDAI